MLIDLPFKKDCIGNFFLHIPWDGYNFSNKSLRIKAMVASKDDALREFNIAQHMGVKGVYSCTSLIEFPSIIQHFTDYEVFFRSVADKDQHPYNQLDGTADNIDQILKHPGLMFRDKTARLYVLAVKLIRKVDQPPTNGWQWKDKGDYIGNKITLHSPIPDSLFLYDDKILDEVLQFNFFEVRRKEN